MFHSRLKTILFLFTTLLTLIIIVPTLAFFSDFNDLDSKLEAKKILKTTEFLAADFFISVNDSISLENLQKKLTQLGYRQRDSKQLLLEKDFSIEPKSEILLVKIRDQQEKLIQIANNRVIAVQNLTEGKNLTHTYFGQKAIAQFVNQQPILQKSITLADTPPKCLQAIIAIEDNQFLDHKGVSATGILRAVFKNIVKGGKSQGGSTITQQLVKNYFLTPEKTFSRKAKEIALAIQLESKFTKDEILETYLNVIYLGQNGSLQIRGYGAASEFYFGKPIAELNLPECALIAAIVNNPGVNNPWKHPEQAKNRRNLVLKKMKELNQIDDTELQTASAAALPGTPVKMPTDTAPYFIDAAIKQAKSLGLPIEGNKIYLSIDLDLQLTAQKIVQEKLTALDEKLKAKKTLANQRLEGVLLFLDLKSGLIQVGVGGRSFKNSQFNRITEAKRQVGSLAKPFVYLSALQNDKIKPDSMLSNQKQTFKFLNQAWSPDNYDKKSGGEVSLVTAIKNSLNLPVAHTFFALGFDPIQKTFAQFDLEKGLANNPSLSLGAFEKTPYEVLNAYGTLARLGQKINSSFIIKVLDSNDKVIYENAPLEAQAADPVYVAELISLLKYVVLDGTAKSLTGGGYDWITAGKTGTTNDYKDAWFVGFTPNKLALVWIGYDNAISHGLTGGSSATPIFKDFMMSALQKSPNEDFKWPAGTEVKSISQDEKNYDLVFKN